MAAILTFISKIGLCQSLRIYLKNIPTEFDFILIRFETTEPLGFLPRDALVHSAVMLQ